MPRRSTSIKAVHGGSTKSNEEPTHPSPQDNLHSTTPQQQILNSDDDKVPPISKQSHDSKASKDKKEEIPVQQTSTLLLGCGARFNNDEDDRMNDTFPNPPTPPNPTSPSHNHNHSHSHNSYNHNHNHSCASCTRLELFTTDNEAPTLHTTSEITTINAARKYMALKLETLEKGFNKK